MSNPSIADSPTGTSIVATKVGDVTVHIQVLNDAMIDPYSEREIASSEYQLNGLLAGISAFAGAAMSELAQHSPARVSIEFGCNISIEAGQLIAFICKSSLQSSIKVGIEWETRSTAPLG
jgi:hypothetical protein